MIYVSNLLTGMDKIGELSLLAKEQNAGMECVIFTDDIEYKKSMEKFLKNNTLPITFHGPYSSVEATSQKGTKEYDFFIDSYKYTFELAEKYKASHIVFHYSQIAVSGDLKRTQEISKENIETLLDLAQPHKVNLLIENLAVPFVGQSLYSLDEYILILKTFKRAGCIIDMGHLNIRNWDFDRMLSEIDSERILAFHLHNNDGKSDSHHRLLDGTCDIKTALAKIDKALPGANLVLEYEPNIATMTEIIEDIGIIRKYTKQ